MTTTDKQTFIATYITNYYAARSSTGPATHAGTVSGHRTPVGVARVYDEAEGLWEAYAAECRRRCTAELANGLGVG